MIDDTIKPTNKTQRVCCMYICTHVSEEHHDPRRYPRPRRENVVPKEVSATPRSRLSEGTAGPRALMNIPSKVNDPNKTSEGNNRLEILLLPRHRMGTIGAYI